MNPQRIAIKFFVEPDPRATVDLEPFIPMFHRFIQQGSVEGLLVDVADYAHVRDGPGVILIGHDVDYGIDTTGGRAGLLVTRKRCGELPLSEAVRDTLRKALIAIRAIEADGSGGLGFATDIFDLQLLDRLATPNDEDAFARVCAEVVPVVEKLWGDAGAELTRARARDARKPLAVTIAALEGRGVGAVLEALGGAPPVRAEKQKEWDLEVEELKRLLASGVDFVLIDVREPHEFEICNLGGELIPLGTLGGKLRELDREAHIVVHCRTGGRSAKAVAALRESGFGEAWNLRGGILAWIERIDPRLAKY